MKQFIILDGEQACSARHIDAKQQEQQHFDPITVVDKEGIINQLEVGRTLTILYYTAEHSITQIKLFGTEIYQKSISSCRHMLTGKLETLTTTQTNHQIIKYALYLFGMMAKYEEWIF